MARTTLDPATFGTSVAEGATVFGLLQRGL